VGDFALCLWQAALGNRFIFPQNGRAPCAFSSQAGCALDCSFCATGKTRIQLAHLTRGGNHWPGLDRTNKSFRTYPAQSDRAILPNVVMMGMGEPLA